MLASNYAYIFLLPDIIRLSTHFSTTNIGFVVAGLYVLGADAMLVGAIHSDRTRERYWHIIVPSILAGIGFIACGTSNRPQILLPAIALIIFSLYSFQGPLFAIPQDFLSGRSAAASLAAINTVGVFGGFLGPYAIGIAKDITGTYQRGLALMAIPTFLSSVIMLYIRYRALATRPVERATSAATL